jgi:Flp pilus assembly protein CpaB
VLAGPVAAGEPVTDVRLVGRGLAAAHPDLTVMPVRLPDAGVAALLRPGDRIDLVAADPGSGDADPIAFDVLVLAVPAATATAEDSSAPPGRLVVLGISPTAAADVGLAAVTQFLVVAYAR